MKTKHFPSKLSVAKHRLHQVRTWLVALLLMGSATALVSAETKVDNKHPTVKIATDYLHAVVAQNWDACAKMLLPVALESEKNRVVAIVKSSPTMVVESQQLQELGVGTFKELENLTPLDLYIRQRKRMHQGQDGAQMKKPVSFQVEVLSVASEDSGNLIHVLFRTVRDTEAKRYRELILLSLLRDQKNKGQWFVVPDSQIPIEEDL